MQSKSFHVVERTKAATNCSKVKMYDQSILNICLLTLNMQIYGVCRGCVTSLSTMHYHLLRNNINVLLCHLFFFFPSGLCLPVVTFFRRISDPEIGSGAVDVYAMMFSCQFIIFIIIVFSWSAFSSPEVFPALFSPEVFRGPAFSVKCSLLLVACHLTNHTNSLHHGCGEVARVK